MRSIQRTIPAHIRAVGKRRIFKQVGAMYEGDGDLPDALAEVEACFEGVPFAVESNLSS